VLSSNSDGVVEALDSAEHEFGFSRLIEEIDQQRGRPLRAGLERIADAVPDWSGGQLRDDVSLLCLERIAQTTASTERRLIGG
jgi:serine phosphatase RsbU (regulator of sigma subunit)